MQSTKTTSKLAEHFTSITTILSLTTYATGILTTTGNKLEINYHMTAENLRHSNVWFKKEIKSTCEGLGPPHQQQSTTYVRKLKVKLEIVRAVVIRTHKALQMYTKTAESNRY